MSKKVLCIIRGGGGADLVSIGRNCAPRLLGGIDGGDGNGGDDGNGSGGGKGGDADSGGDEGSPGGDGGGDDG